MIAPCLWSLDELRLFVPLLFLQKQHEKRVPHTRSKGYELPQVG